MTRERRALQAVLDSAFDGNRRLRVLEAGCGSLSRIELPASSHIVGVDVSARQLERNILLDDRIQADLECVELEPESFDLVICWDVLEHLAHPRAALDNLLQATSPGGVLVLALPNVLSIKGLLAKFTPFKAHVWLYQVLLRSSTAGTADHGPFRTHLRWSLAPQRLERYCIHKGCEVLCSHRYESGMQQHIRRRVHLTGPLWTATRRLVRLLSLGRVDAETSDFILALRRPLAAGGSPSRTAPATQRDEVTEA